MDVAIWENRDVEPGSIGGEGVLFEIIPSPYIYRDEVEGVGILLLLS